MFKFIIPIKTFLEGYDFITFFSDFTLIIKISDFFNYYYLHNFAIFNVYFRILHKKRIFINLDYNFTFSWLTICKHYWILANLLKKINFITKYCNHSFRKEDKRFENIATFFICRIYVVFYFWKTMRIHQIS